MKKIIVDKTEGIAEVIDRILNEPDNEISIVIPKASALGKSVSNFHLLRREADSAGRNIAVESVDETVLAFARESGIESSHPLWKGVRGAGGFSDIVSRKDQPGTSNGMSMGDDEDEPEREVKKSGRHQEVKSPARRGKLSEPAGVREEDHTEEEIENEEENENIDSGRSNFFNTAFRPRNIKNDDDNDNDGDRSSSRSARRRMPKGVGIGIVGVVVIAAIALYIVSAFFNRADVTLNFKQDPWSYQNNFTADKNAVGIDAASGVIPAQVFTDTKNVTQMFKGSSVQNVQQRAQATITIYNNFGTAPQELVATTRFMTPDGKIFRLVNNVTVPGATMANGKLTPATINAPAVADQAGPDYNIGPVAHLTIPGFQKSPDRYNGFYGVIVGSAAGGFIGSRATPTVADIAAAKASTTAILQATLQGGFSGNYPNNFKILDGATMTQTTKLTVNTSTDANGNYTVFGEATLQAIGFDEQALKEYLLTIANAQDANSIFKALTINYASVSANFTKGQVSFALSAQGSLEPQFLMDSFTSGIAGHSISDARSTIGALPRLSDGELSVWPSWLWSIPSNTAKIHVTVN